MSDLESTGPGSDCSGDVASYVLGALPDADYDAFLEHLHTCAVCREEVASLSSVVAALPAAVPSQAPPAALKRRVMSEVEADARLREAAAGTPRRERRVARRASLFAPLAAGLALLAAVLVIVLGGGSGGGGSSRVVRAEVLAPGARGFVSIRAGRAELMLLGMPQPSRGRVYELWIERAGAPEPTDALFTPRSSGRATVGVPGSVTGVRALLVTSEPLGGSTAPTTRPTVVARLG
jgi:anti-sigma-K factor RskA